MREICFDGHEKGKTLCERLPIKRAGQPCQQPLVRPVTNGWFMACWPPTEHILAVCRIEKTEKIYVVVSCVLGIQCISPRYLNRTSPSLNLISCSRKDDLCREE